MQKYFLNQNWGRRARALSLTDNLIDVVVVVAEKDVDGVGRGNHKDRIRNERSRHQSSQR